MTKPIFPFHEGLREGPDYASILFWIALALGYIGLYLWKGFPWA
jgi:hypothetical protein